MMKNLNKLSCSAAAVLLASCIAAPVMAASKHMANGFSAGITAQIGASLLDGKYTDRDSNVSKIKAGDVTVLPELKGAYSFGSSASNTFSVNFGIIPLKGKIEGTAGGSANGDKYEASVERPMALTFRAAHVLSGGGSVYVGAGAARAKFSHTGNTDVTFSSKSTTGPVFEIGTINDVSGNMAMETAVEYRRYGTIKGTKVSNNGAGGATDSANNWEAKPMQIAGKLGLRFGF
jgi:hypothetical protein